MTIAIVLIVAVLIAFLLGGGLGSKEKRARLSSRLDGPREDKWNAWRFPTQEEISQGADPWDLVFVGSAAFPEDAREMLPEQGGQVQQGLTGPVTSWVNDDHELAERARRIARERAARQDGGDSA